jgi:hypothetical protein
VHHRTIQINHQPDATVFQFIIMTFVYSSTCFGRFPVHHQYESQSNARVYHSECDVTSRTYFYAVLLVGPAGRSTGPTTNTAQLSPRYEGKTRSCHCSHWSPDNGRENARNLLSCKQTSGFLISNFRRVLYVVCFLLGDFPAPEFYKPTFRNTLFTFLPMKMEQIECSETSAYKIQTPGNHPEENIQTSG